MEIIPAIDLLDGACVRLHQGDYDQVTRFSEDPVAQALSWQSQGATRLHLVDLDGAKRGEPINDAAVRAITAALDVEYASMPALPSFPEMDATVTMRPYFCRRIAGSTARHIRKMPRTLIRSSRVSSHLERGA